MKRLVLLVLMIFLIAGVYALRINEVEINPTGNDSKYEWIEFYNEGEISLESYIIINNDGQNISLNKSFSGYYVYTFTKQWLDNTDEGVSLYNGLELIDKTDLLDDSKDNDLTYQFCEGKWKFMNSTKGQENNCQKIEQQSNENLSEEQPAENQSEEEEGDNQEEDNSGRDEKNYTASTDTNNLTLKTIELNPDSKNIKSEKDKEVLKRNLALAGIITFCVIFGGALFLLNIKKKKNEFN